MKSRIHHNTDRKQFRKKLLQQKIEFSLLYFQFLPVLSSLRGEACPTPQHLSNLKKKTLGEDFVAGKGKEKKLRLQQLKKSYVWN